MGTQISYKSCIPSSAISLSEFTPVSTGKDSLCSQEQVSSQMTCSSRKKLLISFGKRRHCNGKEWQKAASLTGSDMSKYQQISSTYSDASQMFRNSN